MKTVYVKRVETRKEMDAFVRFSNKLYANCPFYVPDLETDVRNTFIPNKNAGLEYSDIQAFYAYDDEGTMVGRIAGIINHNANDIWKTKNVRFGFFDFIDDQDVSQALLEAVEKWGKERGMDTIIGPMGICDFDKEGMLIEDFDMMGSMNTLYNYPYYPMHMDALGYEKEVDWLQVRIKIPSEVPAKYARVAKLSKEMFGLRAVKLTNRDIRKRGYGPRIFALLNEAYSPLFGFSPLSDKQIESFTKVYIHLVDKQLLSVVEDEKGDVVGVAITMGSLAHAMQKTGGRLMPLGWLHLIEALRWKKEKTADLLLIAVRPDYQGLGVNALFFDDLIPIYNRYGFTTAETGPQLESNFNELSQWKPLNPEFIKRRRCYKKAINI